MVGVKFMTVIMFLALLSSLSLAVSPVFCDSRVLVMFSTSLRRPSIRFSLIWAMIMDERVR